MAKRTKSKKHPKSRPAAQAPAPHANETAAPEETATDALTADPTIGDASTSADTVEIAPQAEVGEPADDAVVVEAEHGEASSEYSSVWSGDGPVNDAVPADAQPAPTATGETATEETTPAAPEETAPEETAPEDAWAGETVAGAETLAAPSDSEPREAAPTDATEGGEVVPIDWADTSETASADGTEGEEVLAGYRLESILESLLFASDKPLGMAELKRLLGERDNKKVTAAVQALTERRKGSGIEVAALSSGWHLRTNPEHAAWVSKLLVGRPVRLSRAMLETLAIVAYRQPVTRPEVDDIRGVDCGPVLKTLLDRGLVRIIGKKEEVGRPMLYGTTPEFLRIFNLHDLSELPTLREFYDLSAEDQSRVQAEHGTPEETPSATTPKPDVALNSVMRGALQPEPEDADPLLDELDEASQLAKQALGELEPPAPDDEGASSDSQAKTDEEPPASPPPASE
jgi:segregation and condensation protein B